MTSNVFEKFEAAKHISKDSKSEARHSSTSSAQWKKFCDIVHRWRRHRWRKIPMDIIESFDIHIIYRSGKSNAAADALSRVNVSDLPTIDETQLLNVISPLDEYEDMQVDDTLEQLCKCRRRRRTYFVAKDYYKLKRGEVWV